MKVAEIFAELGFKIKDENLGEFVNSLSKLSLLSVASAAGLGGIYLALQEITTSALEAANALGNFNAQTGIDTEELQKWQQLGERVGITAQDVTASFSGLQQAVTAIKMGAGNTAPFSFFGLDANTFKTDAEGMRKAMFQISEAYKNADPATRRFLAGQMGLNDSMMQLLTSTKLTNQALDEQFVMLDSGRNSLNELRSTHTQFVQEWRAGMNAVVVALTPAFEGILKIGIAFMELYKSSTAFRYIMNAIFGALAVVLLSISGPITAVVVAFSLWVATLGEIAFYWNEITEAIDDALQAAEKFMNSPMGKLMSGNFGGAFQSIFIPNRQNDTQPGNANDNRQENSLTVISHSDRNSPSFMEELEAVWGKMVGQAAYQRKLKTT